MAEVVSANTATAMVNGGRAQYDPTGSAIQEVSRISMARPLCNFGTLTDGILSRTPFPPNRDLMAVDRILQDPRVRHSLIWRRIARTAVV
jgi:hypothetical protein